MWVGFKNILSETWPKVHMLYDYIYMKFLAVKVRKKESWAMTVND